MTSGNVSQRFSWKLPVLGTSWDQIFVGVRTVIFKPLPPQDAPRSMVLCLVSASMLQRLLDTQRWMRILTGRFSEGLFKQNLLLEDVFIVWCLTWHWRNFGETWKWYSSMAGVCCVVPIKYIRLYDGIYRYIWLFHLIKIICTIYVRILFTSIWYCWWFQKSSVHQLRLVVYPVILQGLGSIPGGWGWDFFHQLYLTGLYTSRLCPFLPPLGCFRPSEPRFMALPRSAWRATRARHWSCS